MLALNFTFLAAAFILGPDLTFRWVLSFVVPRRSISQIVAKRLRAILWALFPLELAVVWVRVGHVLQVWGHWSDVKTVFSGLYSNTFFDTHTQQFFDSLPCVLGMTGSLLWRLYFIVFISAVLLDLAIAKYRWFHGALKPSWTKRF